jgi:hypothetical protein
MHNLTPGTINQYFSPVKKEFWKDFGLTVPVRAKYTFSQRPVTYSQVIAKLKPGNPLINRWHKAGEL